METIKIIDILVKIANDEHVPMFKYQGHIYKYNKEDSWFDDLEIDEDYKQDFILSELSATGLNEEVEIMEEHLEKEDKPKCDLPQYKDWWEHEQERKNKKIENLKSRSHWGGTFQEEQKYRNKRDDEITDKINEIIKKIQVL